MKTKANLTPSKPNIDSTLIKSNHTLATSRKTGSDAHKVYWRV
jgi:hypothetical protein